MKTRRQFLLDCSTLALASGLLPTALVSASVVSPSLCAASFADFAALQGTSFAVSAPGVAAVRLKLIETKWLTSRQPQAQLAADAQNEKFTLLFQGSNQTELTQNTYTFEHPELGRLDIFLVPVPVSGSENCHYAAVFNRPVLPTIV
jgi:hypothetical protein